LSVAGSATQIALATASGRILYFSASTLAQEGTIAFTSDALALSADGSVLAAAPSTLNPATLNQQALNIYALPGAATLYSWPYPTSAGTTVTTLSLAGSGAGLVLAQSLAGPSGSSVQISPPTGGTPSFQSTQASMLVLSPDATVFATSEFVTPSFSAGANLYQNNQLVTAVNGWPLGWIDDTHLLLNNYVSDYFIPQQSDYAGCSVYSNTGVSAGACELPEVLSFQNAGAGTIYANNLNEILDVASGAVSWASGNALAYGFGVIQVVPAEEPLPPYLGTLAGSHVVFVSGSYVLAQSF